MHQTHQSSGCGASTISSFLLGSDHVEHRHRLLSIHESETSPRLDFLPGLSAPPGISADSEVDDGLAISTLDHLSAATL